MRGRVLLEPFEVGIGGTSNSQFLVWKEVNGGLVGFGESQCSLKAIMSWKRRGIAEDTGLFRLARQRKDATSLGQWLELLCRKGALYESFTVLI